MTAFILSESNFSSHQSELVTARTVVSGGWEFRLCVVLAKLRRIALVDAAIICILNYWEFNHSSMGEVEVVSAASKEVGTVEMIICVGKIIQRASNRVSSMAAVSRRISVYLVHADR
jgi:hypothetical protein